MSQDRIWNTVASKNFPKSAFTFLQNNLNRISTGGAFFFLSNAVYF